MKKAIGIKSSMAKIVKHIITKFNNTTKKYEKLEVKAPKGQRRVGVDQNGRIIIYDDKGNVVAVRE